MSLLAPVLARKTAAYTALNGDLVLADATAGAFAVTLPAASVGLAPIRVKKIDASANAVTVTRAGAATIDGATTFVLTAQWSCVELVPDGTNWRVVAASPSPANVPKATFPVELGVAVTDETTAITTGNGKVTFRMPYAMTVTAVRANLNTASSSGILTVDINDSGTTILSTKLTIDATEKTSLTAAVPAVISDTALADDAEITIDIDVAGTGAKGLKVWIIGTRVIA